MWGIKGLFTAIAPCRRSPSPRSFTRCSWSTNGSRLSSVERCVRFASAAAAAATAAADSSAAAAAAASAATIATASAPAAIAAAAAAAACRPLLSAPERQ